MKIALNYCNKLTRILIENHKQRLLSTSRKVNCNEIDEPPPLVSLSQQQSIDNSQKVKLTSTHMNCAVLLKYDGHGFHGMQRNYPLPTIEEEIFNCLLKLNVIDNEKHTMTKKFCFARASKTDKNVSALGQVISFLVPRDKITTLKNEMNSILPPQIRIIDVLSRSFKFQAHWLAEYREYQYILPSFAFAPPICLPFIPPPFDQQVKPFHKIFTISNNIVPSFTDWHSIMQSHRLTPQQWAAVNHLLQVYAGTKNYHNFTSHKKYDDRSSRRHMFGLNCSSPFIFNDMEFVTINICGQSFMIHQIRKMIGLIIAICRGHVNESILTSVFSSMKIDVPKAPAVGLVLKSVNYDSDIKYYANSKRNKPIQWSNYEEEIQEFVYERIYPQIYFQEVEEYSMVKWLNTLAGHSFKSKD